MTRASDAARNTDSNEADRKSGRPVGASGSRPNGSDSGPKSAGAGKPKTTGASAAKPGGVLPPGAGSSGSSSAGSSSAGSSSAGSSSTAPVLEPDGYPIPAPATPLWLAQNEVVAVAQDGTVIGYRLGSLQSSQLDLGVSGVRALAPAP
ncbi:MAG TPA: hypothetical protein VGH89_28290, partial [Pseudonocardia sp.]